MKRSDYVATRTGHGAAFDDNDIIKKNSFRDNFASDIEVSKIIITLLVSFFVGMFIYMLCKTDFQRDSDIEPSHPISPRSTLRCRIAHLTERTVLIFSKNGIIAR